MRFTSSQWIWRSFILISFITMARNVEACDDDFKEALLGDLKEDLFGSFKDALLEDFRKILSNQIDLVNNRLDQSERAIKEVKMIEENMKEELMTLREKVDNIGESLIEIKNVSNETFEEFRRFGNDNLEHLKVETNANLKSNITRMSTQFNTVEDKITAFDGMEDRIKQEYFKSDTHKITNILEIVETIVGCPEGFFRVDTSKQCFKYIGDRSLVWTDAKTYCEAQGLVLARPDDALALRNYLVRKYATNSDAWIGARSTNSSVFWDRDGTTLETSDPLWRIGQPEDSLKYNFSYCMVVESTLSDMETFPNEVYSMKLCSDKRYSICESRAQGININRTENLH